MGYEVSSKLLPEICEIPYSLQKLQEFSGIHLEPCKMHVLMIGILGFYQIEFSYVPL